MSTIAHTPLNSPVCDECGGVISPAQRGYYLQYDDAWHHNDRMICIATLRAALTECQANRDELAQTVKALMQPIPKCSD